MNPYQIIEKAKLEANDELRKLEIEIQEIIDKYINTTGGKVVGIDADFVREVEFGNDTSRYVITNIHFYF